MGSAAFQLLLPAAWLDGWEVEPAGDGARRKVLLIGVRGLGAADAQRWMQKAAIASAEPLMRVRANRTLGAARGAVAHDGSVLALKDSAPTPSGAVSEEPVRTGRIDAGAARASDTALFALEIDPALVQPDAPLVLDWAGLPRPTEIVLFVRHRPAAAS
jgi:hypothetical protein